MNLIHIDDGDLMSQDLIFRKLKAESYDELFLIASDPLVWEQHPVPDRYKEDVFKALFNNLLAFETSFIIMDKKSGEVIGSSTYYNFDEQKVSIGYTFLARQYWGGEYNKSIKKVMIEAAFKKVETICFDIGINNLRSQKALEKLGITEKIKVEKDGKTYFKFILQKKSWV